MKKIVFLKKKNLKENIVVSGYKRQNVGWFEGVKVEVPTISNDSSAEHEISFDIVGTFMQDFQLQNP